MNSNQVSKAVRYALVAGAVSAVAAPSVFAADADQNANASSTAQLGKIEVTGTRIKRTSVETAQPVTIVSAQEIKQSGLTSVGDVLANLSSVYSFTNLQVNNGGDGSNQIQLRNIGPNRVLVLVNGKRWVPNLAGAVDLNTVPAAVIDHVEVLQDGASAIYGSDAIAGVVNIITVKNYNGAEANAYRGIYKGDGHSDGKTQEYDYTFGASGDKSGLVMNVQYTKQDAVFAGDRNISKEPIRGTGNYGGSSGTPNGRFILVDLSGSLPNSATLCQNHGAPGVVCDFTLIAPTKGIPTLSNFKDFTTNDRFNFAPLNYLITPTETTSFFTQGHYDIADNLTFNSTIVYNNRNTKTQLAPEPFFVGQGGSYALGGQSATPSAHFGISASNPYNPFGRDLVGNPSAPCFGAGTCDLLSLWGRRYLEGGDRRHDFNQDTMFWTGGLTGYFNMMGGEWDWDVNSSYGRQSFQDIANGSINTDRLALALGPAFNAGTAANPNFQCGTPSAPISGCVPLDAFGGAGSITPAMQQYIATEQHNVRQLNQRNYTGNISGDLFDLPAGPVGTALGLEYLEDDGFFSPDYLQQSGSSSNGFSSSTFGRERTDAEYVEFNIPIVADSFIAKDLSLDVANRWSQFKWAGGTPGTAQSLKENTANASTARAALRWQVNDELLLRGSWSQGFRLPSISEFFANATDSFLSTADPCAASSSSGQLVPNAKIPKYCPPGISTTTPGPVTSSHPDGHYVTGARPQPNAQILNIIGGNPKLTPEKSISRTVGFVYNPDWLPGFDFSADYYKIELSNEIGTLGGQNIINDCFFANTNCGLVSPGPAISQTNATLPIVQIVNLNLNTGDILSEGIDIETHYKLPSTSVGDFKIGLNASFVKALDYRVPEQVNPDTGNLIPGGFATSELAGWSPSTGGFGGVPKRRANATLAWNYGDWSAEYALNFIGSQREACANPRVSVFPTLCSDPTNTEDAQGFHTNGKGQNHVGATTYHNVEATYHLGSWNTDFTFGIRNLWDHDPPTELSSFANSYDPGLYQTPGRFFYGRIGVKF